MDPLPRHQQFEYDARAIRPDLISSVGSFSSVDNDSCWIVRPSIRRSCVRDKQISDGGRAPSLPTRDRLTARHPCICLRNRRPTIAYQASRISRAEDAGCHNGPAGAPPATSSLVYIYQKHDGGGGTSSVPDRRLASCLWSYQQLTSQLLLICFLLASCLHWDEQTEWEQTRGDKNRSLDLDICWIDTIVKCDTTMSVCRFCYVESKSSTYSL